MKLQVITVSVNYSDFLVHSIEANKVLFDKWIVVTDLADLHTKKLCDRNGITCLQTDAFYQHGIFNKYAGINEALKLVDNNAWVLFLDGDIILHPETRRVLESLQLDSTCIYGVDRLNCSGLQAYLDYKDGDGILKNNWMLTTAGLQLGSRLVHYYGHEGENGRFEGWRPLGFFQLCHRNQFNMYPQNTLGADHCDLLFARQWSRTYRVHIPELLAIHLESIDATKGVNWYGRKSGPFTLENYEEDVIIKPRLTWGRLLTNIRRRLKVCLFKFLRLFCKKPPIY